MVPLLSFLLLAATTSIQLIDEVYRIPANEWRWVPVSLRQQPALISARFQSHNSAGRVRLKLIRRGDLDRYREGLPTGALAATPFGAVGHLVHQIVVPGDYVVVVENEADAPAEVLLRISLDFSHTGPKITKLTPQRQFTVIAISFAVFFGIATWSASRLLRAVRKS